MSNNHGYPYDYMGKASTQKNIKKTDSQIGNRKLRRLFKRRKIAKLNYQIQYSLICFIGISKTSPTSGPTDANLPELIAFCFHQGLSILAQTSKSVITSSKHSAKYLEDHPSLTVSVIFVLIGAFLVDKHLDKLQEKHNKFLENVFKPFLRIFKFALLFWLFANMQIAAPLILNILMRLKAILLYLLKLLQRIIKEFRLENPELITPPETSTVDFGPKDLIFMSVFMIITYKILIEFFKWKIRESTPGPNFLIDLLEQWDTNKEETSFFFLIPVNS